MVATKAGVEDGLEGLAAVEEEPSAVEEVLMVTVAELTVVAVMEEVD